MLEQKRREFRIFSSSKLDGAGSLNRLRPKMSRLRNTAPSKVLLLPELVLVESVQVCNVGPRLCVQVPLLAVGRPAGYAGHQGSIFYIENHILPEIRFWAFFISFPLQLSQIMVNSFP